MNLTKLIALIVSRVLRDARNENAINTPAYLNLISRFSDALGLEGENRRWFIVATMTAHCGDHDRIDSREPCPPQPVTHCSCHADSDDCGPECEPCCEAVSLP